VKIAERDLAVILSEEGRRVLTLVASSFPDSPALWVYVQDADDMGLWCRVRREDGDHLLLIRWEYVLSIDFPAGEIKSVGLRP